MHLASLHDDPGQMNIQRALAPGVTDWAQHPSGITCLLSPQVQIKEEMRLVSIIDQIDKAVAVIPRGALFKTPFGPINVNRTFEGKFSSRAQSDTRLGVQGNLPVFSGKE